ncbi:NUC153 and WD40 repeat-containing nucleolar rRNA processing-related protein [Mycena floridula]|nr:NUC153 and WD40 repeat-containing nucleolar rRNA processing-related protein [Mycena floridula]
MSEYPSNVKVYTVNGAAAGSSSSLPDWLTRKRASGKGKGKRGLREHIEGTIELIQGFEFPEASNRIRTTRDGLHAVATGTYKPQIRVWDLDQLSLKFERHSDAENVDFVLLSDDWTKSIHLQNDRTIELHTQGGFHYRTRIPRFGRSLAYHFPSCDVYLAASGNEIYRLNLDQGRFMNPLVLEADDSDGEMLGVNVIDVNAAHQLLAFGVDGNGTVQFWDPRSRSRVGLLRVPRSRLMATGADDKSALSITVIASRSDGLSYAIGTSTGHTLLYDIRAAQPFGLKDQGYGLPVKSLSWIEGGSRMAGDGMVLSADKKVIKIWDRTSPSTNFASITPAADLNDVHHIPGSGLILTANEGIQMSTFYIPQLGPAPRWASFLENITEEMEDQTVRSVYEDYKFVDRKELKKLGLDHLVGTPALKPYMHGYFISLKLYDTARLIANPFVYAEHREKMVREKMEKMAETRIRAKKEVGVKVNKALAEKVLRDEERAKKREKRKRDRNPDAMEVDVEEDEEVGEAETEQPSLLNDPRFSKVFEDPEFEVDQLSREYALLNPSSFAQKQTRSVQKGKTAVEEEEDESDKVSSDGLGEGSSSEGESEDDSDDSDAAGELSKFDRRVRPGQQNPRAEAAYQRQRQQNRAANVNLVPMRATGPNTSRLGDKNATFGQRRNGSDRPGWPSRPKRQEADGGMEMSWVPSSNASEEERQTGRLKKDRRKGVEEFGAGLEKGGEDRNQVIHENDRKGRTQRRHGVRSGSKNVFRRS